MNTEITIGNELEIFFNRESKSGTWEITYDSTNDMVVLHYFDENGDGMQTIDINKKEFLELKSFLKDIRLTKNIKMKKIIKNK